MAQESRAGKVQADQRFLAAAAGARKLSYEDAISDAGIVPGKGQLSPHKHCDLHTFTLSMQELLQRLLPTPRIFRRLYQTRAQQFPQHAKTHESPSDVWDCKSVSHPFIDRSWWLMGHSADGNSTHNRFQVHSVSTISSVSFRISQRKSLTVLQQNHQNQAHHVPGPLCKLHHNTHNNNTMP